MKTLVKAVDATKPGRLGEGHYNLWTRKVAIENLSTVKRTLKNSPKYKAQFENLMSTTDNMFRYTYTYNLTVGYQ